MKRRWTGCDLLGLHLAVRDGLSITETAMYLSRTRASVKMKAHYMGLRFPVTPEKLARTCNRFQQAREALQAQREMAAAMRLTDP